jgi:hypothetical protein
MTFFENMALGQLLGYEPSIVLNFLSVSGADFEAYAKAAEFIDCVIVAKDWNDAITQLNALGKKIDVLYVLDHGAYSEGSGGEYIGQQTFNTAVLTKADFLALRGVLANNASIRLYGCYVGGDVYHAYFNEGYLNNVRSWTRAGIVSAATCANPFDMVNGSPLYHLNPNGVSVLDENGFGATRRNP